MEGKVIKAVFFDIGNVLLRFDPREVRRSIAAAVCQKPSAILKLAWSGRLADGVERGTIPPREIYRSFQDILGYEGDYTAFRALWCGQFTLDTGSSKLLKRLSSNVPVYLLSNTNHLHYEFIRRHYAFTRHIRGAVLSYRLGLRKPEPGIYLAALKRACVRPEEALFIDDLPENVRGAQKVGMRAVRYEGAEKLEKLLVELGLL
jgi:putative hydrolase of the HAD superfamily